MFAALAGRLALVDYLVESKADVGAVDSTGKSALMLAEQQGADEVIKRLKAALVPQER